MRYPTTVRPVHMRCPNKLHPCNDAKPALPPSMVAGAVYERTWTPCFYFPGQRVSDAVFQIMPLTVNGTALLSHTKSITRLQATI